MTRVKRGVTSKKRHKKVLVRNKGFLMSKRRLIKSAKQADLHAGQYAFAGRKRRKRDMRRLWITRISEGVKKQGLSYSAFIKILKEKHISLNRKVLSQLISEYPEVFVKMVNQVKK